MAGKIHHTLQQWLYNLVQRHRTNFSLTVRHKCLVDIGDASFTYIGKHEGSEKDPDLSIGWKADNQDFNSFQSHTVVEIGVSQTDKSLREVRDLYLTGTQNTQRVILVRVDETPKFDGTRLEDINFKRWKQSSTNTYATISCAGPVYCQDIQCVGALKIVWEVWDRGPTAGQVVKVFSKRIIPITKTPKNREFELPFFEIPVQIAAGVMPVTIKPADIKELASDSLVCAIERQATDRIKTFQIAKMKADQKKLDLSTQKDEAQQKRDIGKQEQNDRARKRSERNTT